MQILPESFFYVFILNLLHSLWDSVPQPGIEPVPLVLKALILNHGAAREFPFLSLMGIAQTLPYSPTAFPWGPSLGWAAPGGHPANLGDLPSLLRSANTYTYLFSQPSRMPIYPKWMGADHADDLQYVFGKPFATPLGYRAQDRTVSKAMIAYWTNFARTG